MMSRDEAAEDILAVQFLENRPTYVVIFNRARTHHKSALSKGSPPITRSRIQPRPVNNGISLKNQVYSRHVMQLAFVFMRVCGAL